MGFVQDRLALFGKVIFAFGVTYLVMALAEYGSGLEPLFIPGRGSHVAATLFAFALWQLARRDRSLSTLSSTRRLKILDGVGTLAVCTSLVLMGHRYAEHASWGYFAGMLSVFHVVLARAIIVPSTPWRTAIITSLAFAGLVLSAVVLIATGVTRAETGSAWFTLIGPITTGATGTALATLASKVIYGLHRDVQKARQLGQYTLKEKIGEGGMGEVYKAQHAMLRRPTAIKLLGPGVSERELHRFEKEVQLTAGLTHPNTISIYDYGRTPEGGFYYVMELLEGVTLQELVERHGPQSPARVIHILQQVGAALREAHDAGLIHRDIKPDNIFLCRRGGMVDVVKVLDFGLVKEIAPAADSLQSNLEHLVGTPLYMSPESFTAPESVTTQSDLYALGAVAYYLLTGTPVFVGETIVEVCSHHLHTQPEPLSDRAPADLEAIVLDCLEKRPTLRPSSAGELLRRLSACADAGTWSNDEASSFWSRLPASAESIAGEPTLRAS